MRQWDTGKPVPRLLASLPCADLLVSSRDGVGTVYRINFTPFAAVAWPAQFADLTIVNDWLGGDGAYEETIRILDPDDLEVARATGTMQFQPAGDLRVPYVTMSTFSLQLARAGTYTIEISLDGAPVHDYPVHAITLTPGGPNEGKDDDSQG